MRPLLFSSGGTRFGSGSTAPPRAESMTTTPASISEQRPYARQRDRRNGFAEWLATLARGLDRHTALRDVFEGGLRTIVHARSVQLREPSQRCPARTTSSIGSESFALDVPGVLDVAFDPDLRLSDWDFQTLAMAAHVGYLVLEIERGRNHTLRSSVATGTRHRRDA